MSDLPIEIDPELDLVLVREVPVPPEAVWRAWTEPELLVQWFTPAPWRTIRAEVDLRPGGIFLTEMQSPEGETMDAEAGCFLEVVPNRKLVWTDGMGPGFRLKSEGFFTGMLFLEPTATGTRYIAVARHGDAAKAKQHAEMGFEQGWGAALDQLVALMS